jgi:hypothetical protein
MTSRLRSLHPFDPDPAHPAWCCLCGRTEPAHLGFDDDEELEP